jgi:hypothetical protein
MDCRPHLHAVLRALWHGCSTAAATCLRGWRHMVRADGSSDLLNSWVQTCAGEGARVQHASNMQPVWAETSGSGTLTTYFMGRVWGLAIP